MKRTGLRTIEANWTRSMANSVETRVRFAMWDAMRLAAAIAGGNGGRSIMKALHRDTSLFDESGHERKHTRGRE